jgi:hypothetical protein
MGQKWQPIGLCAIRATEQDVSRGGSFGYS